jgi:hypothetical protein
LEFVYIIYRKHPDPIQTDMFTHTNVNPLAAVTRLGGKCFGVLNATINIEDTFEGAEDAKKLTSKGVDGVQWPTTQEVADWIPAQCKHLCA